MASFYDTNWNIKKLFYIRYRFYYFLCLLSEERASLDSRVKLFLSARKHIPSECHNIVLMELL